MWWYQHDVENAFLQQIGKLVKVEWEIDRASLKIDISIRTVP